MNYGFIKVASAVPSVKVADCKYNVEQIEQQIILAEGQGVEIIVFPELSLTGYTCQDLFRQNLLLETTESAMLMLLDFTRQLNIISIVGLPIAVGDLFKTCALPNCVLPAIRLTSPSRRRFLSLAMALGLVSRFAKMSGPPRLPAITLRWQVPISSSIFQPATN